MCSRVCFAPGPRCFNISFVIPSGPGAFFCFIFFSTSSSSRRVRHSVIHGSKPAVAEFWSTTHVWVLTSLSAEGEAVLSSSRTLTRTFAAALPVTAPLVVCSVVLPHSELSPFSDFVSCQSFWESLSMLRDAVFVFQLAWACVCFSLSRSAFSWECLLTFCGVGFLSISSLASLSSLWLFPKVLFQYGL